MRSKVLHLKKLSSVTIVLALIVSIWAFSQKSAQSPKPQQLVFFKESDVASFRIDNFIVGLLLQKNDKGEWRIKRVKNELANKAIAKDPKLSVTEDADFVLADPAKIIPLLTTLTTLQVGTPIASAKNGLQDFAINSYSLQLTVFDAKNKELAKISIGKNSPDLLSVYATRGGDDGVYLVDSTLREELDVAYEKWLKPQEKK